MKTPHPNQPTGRADLTEALGHVLGETCRLAWLTRCTGWNARGPYALEIREYLGTHVITLHDALEQAARHVRGLGLPAALLFPDGDTANGDAAIYSGQTERAWALEYLMDAQTRLGLTVSAAMDVARIYDETATLVLLAGRLDVQRAQLEELGQLHAGL